MTTFNTGGRKLALAFTIGAMDAMETRLGAPVDLENIRETVVDQINDRRKLVGLLAILAAEGAALSGDEAAPDEKWLAQHLRPGQLPRAQMAVLEAVADGMRMEAADDEDGEEIDLVLEELKKKQAPGE